VKSRTAFEKNKGGLKQTFNSGLSELRECSQANRGVWMLKICLVQTDPKDEAKNLNSLVSALEPFPAADLYGLPELFVT
jgi:hypothetical protein